MPPNQAAWFPGAGQRLYVADAPYNTPGPDQVLIKNAAIAINPADWKIQDTGMLVQNFPHIGGEDIAGTIVEVGVNVKHLKPGDRVCAGTNSIRPEGSKMGAFQLYSLVAADTVARIPDSVKFEDACVLPLGLATACTALYLSDYLALPYPSDDPPDRGEYVLVWGGSSSVGSCGIQLARNSGYRLITTASARNFEYCRYIGAEAVFDHSSATVVEDIVNFLKGKTLAGIMDAISEGGTVEKSVEISQLSQGSKKVMVVGPGTEKGHPADVKVECVLTYVGGKEVADVVFRQFLPGALQDGRMKTKPDPLVVGKGLEAVQVGLDRLKAGVSAAKVVLIL